jgi:hypothetical protein
MSQQCSRPSADHIRSRTCSWELTMCSRALQPSRVRHSSTGALVENCAVFCMCSHWRSTGSPGSTGHHSPIPEFHWWVLDSGTSSFGQHRHCIAEMAACHVWVMDDLVFVNGAHTPCLLHIHVSHPLLHLMHARAYRWPGEGWWCRPQERHRCYHGGLHPGGHQEAILHPSEYSFPCHVQWCSAVPVMHTCGIRQGCHMLPSPVPFVSPL